MSASAATARPLTGRFVLIAMLAFFAVIIGVNLIMIKLAVGTLPGTDVDSAYRASLAYQSEIVAAHQQNARNWQVDARIERRADGAATLDLHAGDHNGALLSGMRFAGRLERPADRRADRAIEITDHRNGQYRGITADVAPGQWDLVIEGDDGDGKRMFLSRSRIFLK